MGKQAREQMNSTKLRRPLVFRLSLWALFVLYCGVLVAGLSSVREYHTSADGIVPAIALAAVVSVLTLGCLFAALLPLGAYYRWNDLEIRYVTLWRERFRMQWEEIVQVFGIEARRVEFFYVLKDAQGRRLKVDISHIGHKSPLYVLMKKKLPLLDDEKRANSVSAMNFPTGRRRECYVLCDDWLLYTCRSEIRGIRLSAVDQVHEYSEDPARELKRSLLRATATTPNAPETGHTDDIRVTKLVVGTRTTLLITSRIRDYDALVDRLRTRAKDAIWVHTDGPEPQGSLERAAYWRHKIELCRSMRRSLWGFGAVIAGAVLVVTALLVRFGHSLPAGFRPSLAQLAVALGPVAIAFILWRTARAALGLRKLQENFEERLAVLEAEAHSRKDRELDGATQMDDRE